IAHHHLLVRHDQLAHFGQRDVGGSVCVVQTAVGVLLDHALRRLGRGTFLFGHNKLLGLTPMYCSATHSREGGLPCLQRNTLMPEPVATHSARVLSRAWGAAGGQTASLVVSWSAEPRTACWLAKRGAPKR